MSEAAFRKSALEHCTMSTGDACSYPLDGRDLSTIGDDELVWAYAASPKLNFNVSRVAKTAVVKVGFDLAQREAAAMKYVAEHANGRVRLPHVHRSFVNGGRSYLVMEYVDGESLGRTRWTDRDDEQCKIILEQVKDTVLALRTLTRETPGPAGSGTPVGRLFSIYGANRNFQSVRGMEEWLDRKLKLCSGGSLSSKFDTLVMCHMDIALRNLTLDRHGQLWLLDWEWAGFYPKQFEIASLHHKHPDDPDFKFAQSLLQELGSVDKDVVLDLLLHVYQVNDGPYAGSHLLEDD